MAAAGSAACSWAGRWTLRSMLSVIAHVPVLFCVVCCLFFSATTAPTSRPSTAKYLRTENFSYGNVYENRETAVGLNHELIMSELLAESR